MQQRQLGGALRFHVRCYYRPDAAAPTEAWPTDFAGNYHRRALHWLDPSGNDKAPVDRRGRLSAPTCPFWRAPHNSERSRGACGVAAPGAAQIGATRRARDRLRPRRGWRRSVSGGGIRRASPRDTEIHRVLLRGSLPSGTDFRRFGRQTAFDQPRVCAGPAMRDEARRWAALTRTLPRRAHPSISTCCRK